MCSPAKSAIDRGLDDERDGALARHLQESIG